MRQRVWILVAVALIIGAIVIPLLIPDQPKTTVITITKAAQDIKRGTIITADMVEVKREVKEGTVVEASVQVVGKIAIKAIKKGEVIDQEALEEIDARAGTALGKESISFYADIDEALGGILQRGDQIDIYAYHLVQEDEPTRMVKIAACILVVDSHGGSGNPAKWPTPQAEQGGGSILGGGGGGVERVVPASIVTVAVEPDIAWRLIEYLGSRGFRAWVTLSDGSCWMPPPPPSTPTMPDLVIENITTDPDPMVVDQLGTVRMEVKNKGPAEMDASKCWVGLYIDRPSEGDPDKQMFCPPLSVGESAVISYTVTLADVGQHALTAWADWLEAIPEEDETNNWHSADIRVVPPPPSLPMPKLQVTPSTLIFKAKEYGVPAPPQEFSIDNTGEGALEWNATKDADWLNINPTSGLAPSTIVVSADMTNLAAGTYEGHITVEAGRGTQNSPQTITVVLVVPIKPTSALQVAPTTLAFKAEEYGVPAPPQEVSIDNTGEGTLEWEATKDADWLNVNPTSGLAPSTIVVSVDMTDLAAGIHKGHITVSGTGADTQNSPQTITVVLVVLPDDVIPPPHIHLLFNKWLLDTIVVVDLEGRPVELELKPLNGEGIYYADYYGRGFEMTVKNNGKAMHIWREGEDWGADVSIDGLDAWEKRPIEHGQERTIKVQLRDGVNQATVILVDD